MTKFTSFVGDMASFKIKNIILLFLAFCRWFVVSKIFQPILFLIFGRPPRHSDTPIECIQSYDIVADNRPFYSFKYDVQNFLLKFHSLKDVTYIDREDVHLYSVTEEEFVFVRTKSGIDIFNVEKYPFAYDIEHASAEEFLTAPHNTIFQYLSNKSVTDGRNIAHLHHFGRSGSTLVAAMMYKTQQCVVQSECTSIRDLALLMNGKDYSPSRESVEFLDIIRATILLSCPDPNKLYFIKPFGGHTLSLLPLLHQALPGIKEFYIYRSMRPVILSFKKMFQNYILQNIANASISMLPVNYRTIWNKIKCGNGEEALMFWVLCHIHAYIKETRDRKDIKPISYEYLMENKEAFTLELLRDVGIGEEYLEDALSALKRDAHEGHGFSNKALSKGKEIAISTDVMNWAKRIAREEFEIELDGEEGRITNICN